MDFPKFDSRESILTFSLSAIFMIPVYIKNTPTIEYLYFYLCSLRLLFVILAAILLISMVLRLGISRIPFIFLGICLLYTLFSTVLWYFSYSLSFETVTILFYLTLSYITFVVIGLIVLIELSIFLSTYHGHLKLILFFKDIYDFFNHDSPERYRSLTHWNLQDEEIQAIKLAVSLFSLIIISFSFLCIPSVLSSISPRLYDIYAIDGNIKIDMNDEYSTDKIIYVPVEIEGFDTGLSITLSKYDSGKFEETSSLILHPNESITQRNNSLSGNTSDSDSYEIILDPKFMSTGDYKINFKKEQNENTSINKVFSIQ